MTNPKRPVPEDFTAQCKRLTLNRLCAHYRCGTPVIRRWLEETGATALPNPNSKFVLPDDAAELAKTMHLSEMARLFGVTHNRVSRALARAGIIAQGFDQTAPKAGLARPISRPAAHRGFAGPKSSFTRRLSRDVSLEGQAADHLRRDCAVYRCTETGRADQRGTHWRYGNAVLEPAELLARAERRGFDPESWKRLAA